ncbi:flagellar hook assembly protein FlgD [Paragemmobacter ruber]|uniref:Basal-body rod modification protein FlgD n=1 Tax=Paragemmobacter ruber TaxID=1985673 RepID=A0ABW9Y941_9RHOB|nr:flagellar hook capping FlgD N-terminal domain-containing protein [Rhodobacter ruber]NBE09111.1 flagellar biosynthesis protein FlgD [Rhodobacter ruber]
MITFNTTVPAATSTANATAASSNAATANALGQQDFLTLMLAQLKNQDPMQPMENGEFLAQLAQFSTVSGIEKVNDTLESLGDGMRDFRISTAANLLGHEVLVPGNIARAGKDGTINGVVDLPKAASSVTVSYSDATTGTLLHTESYAAQSAGLMGFSWAGLPPAMVENRSPVRVTVSATTDTGTAQVGPSVFAKVLSARNGADGADLTLQIEDYGALNALEVEAFR